MPNRLDGFLVNLSRLHLGLSFFTYVDERLSLSVAGAF